MNKNFILKLISYIIILLAPIFWLLKVLFPAQFGWFNLSLAVGFVTAGLAIIVVVRSFISTNWNVGKKFNIFVAAALGVISVFCFISAFALPKNLIAPIVCIVLAVALILGLVVGGGHKWDEGDNHAEGYKNYHQRKAEEQQKAVEAEKSEQNNAEEK